MNRTVKLAALIAVTAGTLGPAAPAQAAPTARTTTISDHPAVVRVVVRFSGSALAFAAAEASDVNPSNRGAAMRVDQPGIGTTASTILGEGVRVRIRDLGNRLRIGMRFKPGRFKYVDYHQRAHRLTIDLYKDRPPVTGAEIRRGEGGCLRLISHADSGGAIRATGTARN